MANQPKCLFKGILWFCVFLIFGKALRVPCETGWTTSPTNTSCVKVFFDRKRWWDAHRSCRTYNGSLITPVDSKTVDYLKDLIKRHRNTRGGVHVNVRNFKQNLWWHVKANEDETTHQGAACGQIKRQLVFKQCTMRLSYVCEKAPDLCSAPWFTSGPSGTCLKVITKVATWREAREICQDNGADLVKIINEDMNNFITDQFLRYREYNFYIGLSDMKLEGRFQWLDYREPVVYRNWDKHQPARTSPLLDCAIIVENTAGGGVRGGWRMKDCSTKHAFVCEKFSDCKNHKFGMLCPIDCNTTNCAGQGKPCNILSGVCYKGCKTGFTGKKCDTLTGDFHFIRVLATVFAIGSVIAVCLGMSGFLLQPKDNLDTHVPSEGVRHTRFRVSDGDLQIETDEGRRSIDLDLDTEHSHRSSSDSGHGMPVEKSLSRRSSDGTEMYK